RVRFGRWPVNGGDRADGPTGATAHIPAPTAPPDPGGVLAAVTIPGPTRVTTAGTESAALATAAALAVDVVAAQGIAPACGVAAVADATGTGGADSTAPPRRWRRLQIMLAWIPPAAVVGWVIWRWRIVHTGLDAIAHADHSWLFAAMVAASATFVAGAACQQGAVLARLPVGQLLAVQVAGALANHILPAGIGVGAVNLRFLRRRGMSGAQALGAVTLNTTVGALIHLLLLAALVLIGHKDLPIPHVSLTVVGIVAGALVLALAILAVAAPRWRRAAGRVIAERWAELRLVLVAPKRAVLLWGGSAAVPVLHALTLDGIVKALDLHISTLHVLTAYFVATTAAALIPSPGGLGALDLSLGLALTAYNVGLGSAVTAVVGYRLLTTWLPLLPSAVTFGVLVRRRVV
ncbi:MAG: lysylphosphatidylglycerol synthase transmembrane domain-containing protein, partial [Frankia sp.]